MPGGTGTGVKIVDIEGAWNNSHEDLPVVDLPPDRLERVEWVPFTAAIAAGVDVVMSCHLLVPSLDEQNPATLSPQDLATFETVFRARKGQALARLTDGLCEACRVRLRPHLNNLVRQGDQIIQCESCQRILYFIPPPKTDAAPAPESASS